MKLFILFSKGITLWEIYSLGEHPYANIDNSYLKHLLKIQSRELLNFLPISKEFSSDQIVTHLIIPCLTLNLYFRPRFKDLSWKINSILQ